MYRTRSMVVDAFRWEGQPEAEWPDWVKPLVRNANYEDGVLLGVFNPAGVLTGISSGAWLVRYPNGDVTAMAAKQFDARIEEIIEEAAEAETA